MKIKHFCFFPLYRVAPLSPRGSATPQAFSRNVPERSTFHAGTTSRWLWICNYILSARDLKLTVLVLFKANKQKMFGYDWVMRKISSSTKSLYTIWSNLITCDHIVMPSYVFLQFILGAQDPGQGFMESQVLPKTLLPSTLGSDHPVSSTKFRPNSLKGIDNASWTFLSWLSY